MTIERIQPDPIPAGGLKRTMPKIPPGGIKRTQPTGQRKRKVGRESWGLKTFKKELTRFVLSDRVRDFESASAAVNYFIGPYVYEQDGKWETGIWKAGYWYTQDGQRVDDF